MKTFQPLAVLFSYRREDGAAVFLGRSSEVVVEDYVDELYRILRHCNGYRTINQVRTKAGDMDPELFDALIATCVEQGIVCDSRELQYVFHQDSANPMQFAVDPSPDEIDQLVDRPSAHGDGPMLPAVYTALGSFMRFLTEKRASTRRLSDAPIAKAVVWELLLSMYTTEGSRSTPSAGKLYPLEIFMVVTSRRQQFAPGIYRYDPRRLGMVKTDHALTEEKIARALDLPEVPGGLVLFVTANLAVPASKYANRGYRYALLEAGHAAQNAYLFAAEKQLGIVEYGGFDDVASAKLLGLDYPKQAVLTSLIVGYSATEGVSIDQDTGNTLWRLKENLIGRDKPVEWLRYAPLGQDDYALDKILAVASYNPPMDTSPTPGLANQCYGQSPDSRVAAIKALAEAYERHASGKIRWDVVASANELTEPWLDPRQFTPFQPQQYRFLSELTPFDPSDKYQWVRGYRYNGGEPILVPVEHAFYPVKPIDIRRTPCYTASSSGVAAHFDYDTALKRAMLELVERDAIMATWYGQRQVTILPDELLSDSVRHRKAKWERLGWQVSLLNITTDSVPVVMALITSEEQYPHAVSGAQAASSFDAASNRALEEAEVMLVSWRLANRREKLQPEQVVRTIDHGLIYFQPENLQQLDWLRKAKVASPAPISEVDILAQFNPVVVDLARASNNTELHVVRVMSEVLLPINFGYGGEHHGHSRLPMLGLEWNRGYPSFPHLFA